MQFLKVLEPYTTPTNSRRLIRAGEIQAVRMACGKPALPEFPFGSNSSQTLKERLEALRNNWLQYVTMTLPESQLSQTYGTSTDGKDSAQDRHSQVACPIWV